MMHIMHYLERRVKNEICRKKKDLDKAKCNLCGSSGIYITKIPYPLGVSRDLDLGMRLRVCLCKECMKRVYQILKETY